MSARETLNRWVEAMQILCGHDDNPGPERRAGYEETRRKMLDAAYAELLAEAKIEVVAWLVKKAAEGTPVGELASKVDRGAVRIFLGTGHYRDAMDAHRAQVLNEAADMVHAMADPQCTCGGCDSCAARGYAKALREKVTAVAATATPDFFVPGRTYTSTDRYKLTIRFACEHLTVDPQNGRREAWGWLHRANGSRCMQRLWADDYPQWTPGSGEGRG